MTRARLFLLAAIAVTAAQAQSWDTSGNSMLNGTYYFRQVYYVLGDQYGDLSEAVATYGNIKFDGNGNYSITTNEKAVYVDTGCQCTGPLTATGTYSVAASGYALIASPYATGDTIYGVVSAQGIFVGSSTENQNGYNDMMVAAPVASPLPTNSSFTGSWVCADFDFSSGTPANALSLLFPLSPDGNGNLGNVTVTGYYGNGGSTALPPQVSNGLKYAFSNGAAVATFPNNGTLIQGQKYLYFSKDGNFVFGGSPNSFDFIVGVKTNTGATALSGLYYQAGLDLFQVTLDSYYGAFNVVGSAAPQTFLGHERLNTYAGSSVEDYTYENNAISFSGSTYSNSLARYIVGDGGAVMITAGTGPFLGLSVAVKAPSPSGSGVYLSPIGVVNSASSAPFTAGIAPGELLTLYGSNLATDTVVSGIPFQTSLGNVQVSIGGLPAPLYYVSSSQISAIVPYGIDTTTTAAIQVNNKGSLSNVVYEYVSLVAPGVFTQNQNGTGYGEIEHTGFGNSKAVAGSLVTDASPAIAGETLSIYMTGLGAVSPAVADGAPGPSPSLSNAINTISVTFGSTPASPPLFSGLAPGFSGLYQLNVTVPPGVSTGPNFVDISGPDGEMSYLLVPIGTASSSALTAEVSQPAAVPVPSKFLKRPPAKSTRKAPGGGR